MIPPDIDPTGGPLWIHKVLVDYEGPQVFLAKNSGRSQFLAMHALPQRSTERWLYVRISQARATRLERGHESLRRAFEDYEFTPPVIARFDGDHSTIDFHPDEDELRRLYPHVDSFLDTPSDLAPDNLKVPAIVHSHVPSLPDVIAPLWETDSQVIEFFRRARTPALVASKITRRPVLDIAFAVGKDRTDYPIRKLGSVLTSTQSVFDALCASSSSPDRGPIPREYTAAAELVATASFPSSFGIRIEADHGSLIGDTLLEVAIGKFVSAIQAVKIVEEFDKTLQSFPTRAQRHFKSFATALKKGRSSFMIEAGLPDYDETIKAHLSISDVDWLYQRLRQKVSDVERVFETKAKLIGASVKSGFFMIMTEDGAEYSGKMSDVALSNISEKRINFTHWVKIEERVVVNESTGDETYKYTLLDISEDL